MKKLNVGSVIVIATAMLAPQTGRSQGTIYASTLSQPSAGSLAVGSDSLVGEGFFTGNNSGGYALDSVQLAMTTASGAPSGFEVSLYTGVTGLGAFVPGSSLGTLSASSTDPVTGGLYTYTASGLTLSPSSAYFIVVTSGTAVATGAYAWSYENTSPASTSGGWSEGVLRQSSDGTSWNGAVPPGLAQIALTATATPEPDTLYLLGLPGLLFFAWRRWRRKPGAG